MSSTPDSDRREFFTQATKELTRTIKGQGKAGVITAALSSSPLGLIARVFGGALHVEEQSASQSSNGPHSWPSLAPERFSDVLLASAENGAENRAEKWTVPPTIKVKQLLRTGEPINALGVPFGQSLSGLGLQRLSHSSGRFLITAAHNNSQSAYFSGLSTFELSSHAHQVDSTLNRRWLSTQKAAVKEIQVQPTAPLLREAAYCAQGFKALTVTPWNTVLGIDSAMGELVELNSSSEAYYFRGAAGAGYKDTIKMALQTMAGRPIRLVLLQSDGTIIEITCRTFFDAAKPLSNAGALSSAKVAETRGRFAGATDVVTGADGRVRVLLETGALVTPKLSPEGGLVNALEGAYNFTLPLPIEAVRWQQLKLCTTAERPGGNSAQKTTEKYWGVFQGLLGGSPVSGVVLLDVHAGESKIVALKKTTPQNPVLHIQPVNETSFLLAEELSPTQDVAVKLFHTL